MALREKYNLKQKDKTFKINVEDIVLIKGEEKNRGYWKIGIENQLYIDKGNNIRVAQLHIGEELIDRPIQLLYLLQLHCEGITVTNEDEKKSKSNPSSTEFHPKRTTTEIKKWR